MVYVWAFSTHLGAPLSLSQIPFNQRGIPSLAASSLSRPSLSLSSLLTGRGEKELKEEKKVRELRGRKMVMWVFGYGSLIWKAGFQYDQKLAGFIKGYRRVFYQGSTDHRGTPAFPGRTVTLEPAPDDLCWGVAYKVNGEEDENIALTYLEVREKQYDHKVYADFFTDLTSSTPAVSGVMVYVASPDRKANKNYLGPAPLEEIAKQIIQAEGPSGPNRDYLFQLEAALNQLECEDLHVRDIANAVRQLLKEIKLEY